MTYIPCDHAPDVQCQHCAPVQDVALLPDTLHPGVVIGGEVIGWPPVSTPDGGTVEIYGSDYRWDANAEVYERIYENCWPSDDTDDVAERPAGYERLVKNRENKPPLSMLPTLPLQEVGRVLQFGAKKYQRDLWRTQPMDHTHEIDSILRHILAFNEGEDNDPETGLNHIAHAICRAMFLLERFYTHPHLDNRYHHPVTPSWDQIHSVLCVKCGGEATRCGCAFEEGPDA